jgi:hypothetical protein
MITNIIGITFSALGVAYCIYRYGKGNKEAINTAIALFGQVILWIVIMLVEK